jgi:hypothetical protein
MNWAWWDGKMPVHHYREEHGLDTEALAEAEGQAAADASQARAEDAEAKPEAKPPRE